MTVQRLCSKTACGRPASCTLTYNYAESTVVLGPLAQSAEPHSYDLCADHANRMTAPRGWEIVRLVEEFPTPPPAPDELVAIADAIRPPKPAQQPPQPAADVVAQPAGPAAQAAAVRRPGGRPQPVTSVEVGRTSHLHVVPQPADADDQGDDA